MNRSLCIAAAFGLLCVLCSGQAMAQEKKTSKYNAYDEFARANKYVSYGSYSRAIPHYEHALEADSAAYGIAHYNLGEIYRSQKNCIKAAFHYRAYLGIGNDKEALELSKKSLEGCDASTWPTLTVNVSTPNATIYINDFAFATGTSIDAMKFGPGTYDIRVEAPEFITQQREVTLKSEKAVTEDFSLEKQTFFGSAMIKVDQPGAQFKLVPKKLDKPELSQGDVTDAVPLKNAVKLPTGKYLLEVTLDGYDRWIRHIYVTRDQSINVDVTLTKSLPIELRTP